MEQTKTKWETKKLKDLPIAFIDGDRSKRYPKREEFMLEGVPFVNALCLNDNRLNFKDLNFISIEKYNEIKKGRLQKFDIIINTRGNGLGKLALFDCKYKIGLINAQLLIIRSNYKVLNPKFLFYYFSGKYFQDLVRQYSSGAAQPQIPIRDLAEIEITIAPLSIQQKIASILSAYDDLIENNTRRIQILEDMAQNIYKEWFVKFKYPGHEGVKMVESELGLIPEGWEVKAFTELVDINPRTSLPQKGKKSFASMECLNTNSMMIQNVMQKEGNSGAKFKNGDTLFARITPCLENGKTGYVQFLKSKEEIGFGSTEFIVLRSKLLCPELVYLTARNSDFRENAIKSMTGASGRQRVQVECFSNYFIPTPPSNIIKKFQTVVSSMFKSVHLLSLKNKKLQQTRDLLLPRLISGEIDVENLDIEVKEE